jgi:ribosomal protein S27AE
VTNNDPAVNPKAPFPEILARVVLNGKKYAKHHKLKQGITVSLRQQNCPKCHRGTFYILWNQETGFYFRCQNCGATDWIEHLNDPPVMVEKP